MTRQIIEVLINIAKYEKEHKPVLIMHYICWPKLFFQVSKPGPSWTADAVVSLSLKIQYLPFYIIWVFKIMLRKWTMVELLLLLILMGLSYFLGLGHLRYHPIPALANLHSFLAIFKNFQPHHHHYHDVTDNKISQILPAIPGWWAHASIRNGAFLLIVFGQILEFWILLENLTFF